MSLAQLSHLLPLPEADLQQVLDYAATLNKQEAADHFNNLLGETPQSIEFISTFNSRREDTKPPSLGQGSLSSEVPKPIRRIPKKKPALHTPAPRQIDNYDAPGTSYTKRDEQDYIPRKPANKFALRSQPTVQTPTSRTPPSAASPLISDLKPTNKSTPNSRTSSPASRTKVTLTGGTPMHGASAALGELNSAIRSLEIQTNPTKNDNASRACNCIATKHPLLTAAPNCLSCGKVICVKEGLGPCTFCGTPLLSSSEIQGMIRELKEERGREKMALDASSHRRAEVSKLPAPFSAPRSGGPTPGEASLGLSAAEVAMRKAQEHRDRLLGFQAQNTKRTTVRDEARDFETPDMGTSIWASPAERARQLKAQQKVLREQEWNAQPEYEKRRQVVSIDLVGGKVVKRMAALERPREVEDEEGNTPLAEVSGNEDRAKVRGAFSQNPLMNGLTKPVYNVKGKEVEKAGEEPGKKTWRRVQDDYYDNEEIILDGGMYGGDCSSKRPGTEEHDLG
jgi:Putative zinc finger motif, C2HC5-type